MPELFFAMLPGNDELETLYMADVDNDLPEPEDVVLESTSLSDVSLDSAVPAIDRHQL